MSIFLQFVQISLPMKILAHIYLSISVCLTFSFIGNRSIWTGGTNQIYNTIFTQLNVLTTTNSGQGLLVNLSI